MRRRWLCSVGALEMLQTTMPQFRFKFFLRHNNMSFLMFRCRTLEASVLYLLWFYADTDQAF
jgi:hypothetical protein